MDRSRSGSGRFEVQTEPELSQSVVYQQSVPPGSTSRSAADGQTAGPDQRAVDSHVQSSPLGRLSGQGTRGKRSLSVSDQAGSMKKLDDYFLVDNYSRSKPRKKTPVRVSKSPMLSPDTLDALKKAENLVKEAQKTIIEVSYDVASSPEREQSIGSARKKETEDEDAIYIREIVATRFYEANESARIFTRPSTRPLAERLCRPMVRHQRRSRRARERSFKICSDESTTSQPKSMLMPRTKARKSTEILANLRGEHKKFPPSYLISDEEKPTRILKNTLSGSRIIDNQNVTNSLTVQTGPPVDIRNELTITSVEKVNILPCTSLPAQRNIKTYEFRHDSCVNTVKCSIDAEVCSTEPISVGNNIVAAGDSLGVPEKSRDSITKSRGTASKQGSRSDLVENKSGQSIPPERLEGHSDNVRTRSEDRGEHVPKGNKENKKNELENIENRGECFIDFLRFSGNSEQDKNEILRRQVFQSIDTNDKINIFDKAVDQFLEEFRHEELHQAQANVESVSKQLQVKSLRGNNVDENLVKNHDRDRENFIREEFCESEYFEEEWDTEEINLQPPNLVQLEKILIKADNTMDKVLRGTKSLAVLMSEYSIKPEIAIRPGLINQDSSYNTKLFYSVAGKDISSDLELRHVNHIDKKASDRSEDSGEKAAIISSEYLIDTHENVNDISETSHYYTKTKREVVKKLTMERESNKKLNHHPRFSTPLNNGWKNVKTGKTDCNEFARFLIGIQQPRDSVDVIKKPSSRNPAFARIENRDEDKITLKENEYVPASATVTRNDLELRKQIVLDEINRNCNFDSLLDKDRLNRVENDEKTQETQTLPNYPTRERVGSLELRNSGTRSLIQDSAIGRMTDQSDRISLGTKLIDEYIAKIDSSRSERCAPPQKDSSWSKHFTTEKDAGSENIKSMRTKTFTMKKDVTKTAQELKKSETKLSSVDPENSLGNKNKSTGKDKEELCDKNQLVGSPGSSLKDRTSFDISTAYSEDFEEPVTSSKKLKAQEKTDVHKSLELKSISNRVEIEEPEKSVEDNKKDISKSELTSSLQSTELRKLHNESKEERPYLDRSISISVSKSSGKMGEDKKSNKSLLVEMAIEEKGTVECNSEMKEVAVILPEMVDKSCRDDRSVVSTSGSTKVSGTSSIAGESRLGDIKTHKKLNNDAIPGNFGPGKNLIARSRLMTDEMFGKSDCKESTINLIGEPNETLEKSNSISTIGTAFNDSLESNEEINPSLNNEAQQMNKSLNELDLSPGELNLAECRKLKEFAIFESSVEFHSTPKHLISSEPCELNCPMLHDEKMQHLKNDLRDENEKNPGIGRTNSEKNKRDSAITSNFEEITNFLSSIMIDLTPKHLIENSRYTSEEFFYPVPHPIPNDDHVTTAADTCSENYSEGELYLPSSCSYSLGEIRISERGSYGTAGAVIQSSFRNTDGMKIYFGKKNSTRNSDNTIKESNFQSLVLSPGELQETDVESISSS